VQPSPVIHVAGRGQHPQGVVGRQVRELQPATVERSGGQRLAVELSSRDRRSYELDKRVRARTPASKGNCRLGAKRIVAGGQVEPYVVVEIEDEVSPVLCFTARQVVANGDWLF
jgi:hypothetical protein